MIVILPFWITKETFILGSPTKVVCRVQGLGCERTAVRGQGSTGSVDSASHPGESTNEANNLACEGIQPCWGWGGGASQLHKDTQLVPTASHGTYNPAYIHYTSFTTQATLAAGGVIPQHPALNQMVLKGEMLLLFIIYIYIQGT